MARPRGPVSRSLNRFTRSAIAYGVVAGALSAIAGEWLQLSPPSAYGLCSACHGRDLVNWILNHTEGARLYVAAAGTSWPMLTVIGVIGGSFLASRTNGEFKAIDLGGNIKQFLFGAAAMCAALFVGGCPTRIILRTGYGDLAAALALGGVAIGIVVATLGLRWQSQR